MKKVFKIIGGIATGYFAKNVREDGSTPSGQLDVKKFLKDSFKKTLPFYLAIGIIADLVLILKGHDAYFIAKVRNLLLFLGIV